MKFESCRGLTIWKSKKRRIELWFCPPRFYVSPHRHPHQDIELTFLFGSAEFYRLRGKSLRIAIMVWPFTMFRTMTIEAQDYHGFETGSLPLIFFNNCTWLGVDSNKSPSEDVEILTIL